MSGGGTAGHIYPALTVAGQLAAEGHEVAFVGTPDGLEARLVPEAGIPFVAVKARGFDRSNPLSLVTSAAVVLGSVVRARAVVRSFAPDVVVGFGGYVSLPVGFAAVTRRVPLVLHEQNSVPGLANRVLSRWAAAIGVTYESSRTHLRQPDLARVTGNPVRPAVLEAQRARGRKALGLDPGSTVLLVFGGSRGARHLNDVFAQSATALMADPSLEVLHVAGRTEAASVAARVAEALAGHAGRYVVAEYIDAMGDAIAAADLIVARAGATSIAEITAIGRASVLVPYPYATDDHQTLNARTVADAGAAVLVADSEIDSETFRQTVMDLLADEHRRDRMARASAALGRRDAGSRVVAMIVEAARKRKEQR